MRTRAQALKESNVTGDDLEDQKPEVKELKERTNGKKRRNVQHFKQPQPRKKANSRKKPPMEQPDCRLLSLPPEIRNRIWELVLYVHEKPAWRIHLEQKHYEDLTGRETEERRSNSALRLLATCRQVNEEAAGIFYNVNALTLNSQLLRPLKTERVQNEVDRYFHSIWPDRNEQGFLEIVSKPRLAGIRDLRVQCWDVNELVSTLGYLSGQLPRLQKLQVLFTHSYKYPELEEAIKATKSNLEGRIAQLEQVQTFEIIKSTQFFSDSEKQKWEALKGELEAFLPRNQTSEGAKG